MSKFETKTDKMKEITRDYFKMHFTALKFFGISIKPVENSVLGILYKIYSVILFTLCFICFPIAQLLYLLQNADLENSTLVLSYLLTHALGTLKLILVLISRKKIAIFCHSLETGLFLPDQTRSGDMEFVHIRKAIDTSNNQVYIFYFLVVMIVSQRIFYAIRDPGSYASFWNSSANITVVRHVRATPFYCVVPFDQIVSPYYEITAIYQSCSAAFYGFVIGAVDAIICGIMSHVKAQLLILKDGLKTYIQRGVYLMKKNNIHSEVSELERSYELDYYDTRAIRKVPLTLQKYVNVAVNQLIAHHQDIFELAYNAEDTFSLLMLVQFLFSLFLICFQLFQLSLYKIPSIRFFSMVSYFSLILFQLALFCWHGNEVMLRSLDISGAVFEGNWIVTGVKIQRSLLIMMTRAYRPIKMTAGKFVVLSLESFISLIRGSGSYFMVLKNMNAPEE